MLPIPRREKRSPLCCPSHSFALSCPSRPILLAGYAASLRTVGDVPLTEEVGDIVADGFGTESKLFGQNWMALFSRGGMYASCGSETAGGCIPYDPAIPFFNRPARLVRHSGAFHQGLRDQEEPV